MVGVDKITALTDEDISKHSIRQCTVKKKSDKTAMHSSDRKKPLTQEQIDILDANIKKLEAKISGDDMSNAVDQEHTASSVNRKM